jgi:DNA repair protein RadA
MATQNLSKGTVNCKAIYIDTQGKFRPERIADIAKSRGFDAGNTLSNILSTKTMNTHQQELAIKRLQFQLDTKRSIKLLIIDSVTSNYRAELSAVHKLSERQKKLYKFMCSLSTIAQIYDIAVVVTNQVNFSGHSGTAKPSGGSVMTHASTYRISLTRLYSNKISAKITSSLYHPENRVYMMMNEKGIDDVIE